MKTLFLSLTICLMFVQLFVATVQRSNLIVELSKGNKRALASYQAELREYKRLRGGK